MATMTVKDGTQIYFKDWGEGEPIVFSHGWPLTADAWDAQMMFLASQGYRCIAHDRRGHGRSSQPWDGNEMDTYADDLAALVAALDLRDAIHVGHSTGGGEVARLRPFLSAVRRQELLVARRELLETVIGAGSPEQGEDAHRLLLPLHRNQVQLEQGEM